MIKALALLCLSIIEPDPNEQPIIFDREFIHEDHIAHVRCGRILVNDGLCGRCEYSIGTWGFVSDMNNDFWAHKPILFRLFIHNYLGVNPACEVLPRPDCVPQKRPCARVDRVFPAFTDKAFGRERAREHKNFYTGVVGGGFPEVYETAQNFNSGFAIDDLNPATNGNDWLYPWPVSLERGFTRQSVLDGQRPKADHSRSSSYYSADQYPRRPIGHFLLGGQIIFGALGVAGGGYGAFHALIHSGTLFETVAKFALCVLICAFGLIVCGIGVELALG